jgi:hypothetical protein
MARSAWPLLLPGGGYLRDYGEYGIWGFLLHPVYRTVHKNSKIKPLNKKITLCIGKRES